jgi:hypothetical protein
LREYYHCWSRSGSRRHLQLTETDRPELMNYMSPYEEPIVLEQIMPVLCSSILARYTDRNLGYIALNMNKP